MADDYLPLIHHLTNWISKTGQSNVDAGFISVKEADERISAWVKKGYEIIHSLYLGENPQAYGVLFILKYAGK